MARKSAGKKAAEAVLDAAEAVVEEGAKDVILMPNGQPFRVHPYKLEKPNVCITGFTDHRTVAFGLPRDEWCIWGLNELHRYHDISLFDRWFEIHERRDLEGDPDHLKTMGTFDIPVYMHRHWDDIPASLPFPKEFVEAACGTYMTSSPAWMIGLAIAMGAQKIAVVGIDMAQETEYFEQRSCCEYLIGFAQGKGIEVMIPETSDLMKAVGQYGFDPHGRGFTAKLAERLKWLHSQDNDWLGQIRSLDAQYEQTKQKLEAEYRNKRESTMAARFQVYGAIQDCEYWKRSWSVPGDGKFGEPTPDRTLDPRTGIKAA